MKSTYPSSSSLRLLRLLSLIILLPGLSACKLFKKNNEGREERMWKAVLADTQNNRSEFETMSLQGRVNVSMPEGEIKNISLGYRLMMANDSLMVLRISKIIEVARVKITRDSIYVKNSLDETLMVGGYQLAEEYTGLQADFGLLQDLLLGHFHPIPGNLAYSGKQGERLIFQGTESGTKFSYEINQAMQKLVRMQANQPLDSLSSTVDYSDFQEIDGQTLPARLSIEVLSEQDLSIGFQHRKIQINPNRISFAFPVPAHYERISMD